MGSAENVARSLRTQNPMKNIFGSETSVGANAKVNDGAFATLPPLQAKLKQDVNSHICRFTRCCQVAIKTTNMTLPSTFTF